VPLEDLKPHPQNPNRHPKEQIERLARLIEYHGWRAPITVSNQSGFVIRGHCRWEAGKVLGCLKGPVDYQDYASEAQELEDLMADNYIQELAFFDVEQAAQNVRGLAEMPGFDPELMAAQNVRGLAEMPGFDPELMGVDDAKIKRLLEDAERLLEGGEPPGVDPSEELVECPKCGHRFTQNH
jgi:ParB-like chromosome segregation protein Spo0J